jgi:protein SCO1/2/putative membrane protein
MIDVSALPAIDAGLNAVATGLLITGRVAIARKDIALHKSCMIAAFVTSIVFLACYLTYHTLRQMQEGVGHTRFAGPSGVAIVYYILLISHIILAATVPVLAVITLWRAWKQDFERHRRIARWTFPIWLYVSVTGVVIYFMLYHWPR